MIEFESLLRGLTTRRIPFVVVGAVAVGVNAAIRATRDLDILIPSDQGALDALRGLLDEWNATALDGGPLPGFIFDGEHGINALTPHGRLDVLIEGESPLTYAEIAANAHRVELGGDTVLVCGLAELVALKRLAGRPIDREDLRRLEEAHGALPLIELPPSAPSA